MTPREFLMSELSRPIEPGLCCRMIDRWIFARTGRSALAVFGRDFQTDDDVKNWLAEPGGIVVAVNRVMRAAGFRRTREPTNGDVAIVRVRGDFAPAIMVNTVWIGRAETGMFAAEKFWKSWRIA